MAWSKRLFEKFEDLSNPIVFSSYLSNYSLFCPPWELWPFEEDALLFLKLLKEAAFEFEELSSSEFTEVLS